MKLVVSGPVGAGKTTFIRTIADGDVLCTDERSTEAIGKTHTTVALDYGNITVGDTTLHLFGTPGQDRFDFMWDVLCEGAVGLLLLVAGHRPEDFAHARAILEFIGSRIAVPCVIAVTFQDLPDVWAPAEVAGYFGVDADTVVGANAGDPRSCHAVVARLLDVIDQT